MSIATQSTYLTRITMKASSMINFLVEHVNPEVLEPFGPISLNLFSLQLLLRLADQSKEPELRPSEKKLIKYENWKF
ncbi:hypothetical protein B9Z55_001082 [Caenorhabditis nigoni]|uniref:Uncharacterized protein n=1 Tax=Caenorhabditis nigoni TaxID=1611254 RepID=A0A2G5VE26_9PELO|nr:hypothetical protein B9Z55_001082 [Caenorhabditis nigoni]